MFYKINKVFRGVICVPKISSRKQKDRVQIGEKVALGNLIDPEVGV